MLKLFCIIQAEIEPHPMILEASTLPLCQGTYLSIVGCWILDI
jgi:hypothetical protein